MFIGTSSGAINACLFAANAHLSAEEQAKNVLAVWRGIEIGDVLRPVALTAMVAALSWAGQLARLPGMRLTGFLDTAPLHRTAARRVDWTQLAANLAAGCPRGLVLTATSGGTGRSVVFVDRPADAGDLPVEDTRAIDYVSTRIGVDHMLASAAIPVLFPPVEVTEPESYRGWYSDEASGSTPRSSPPSRWKPTRSSSSRRIRPSTRRSRARPVRRHHRTSTTHWCSCSTRRWPIRSWRTSVRQ